MSRLLTIITFFILTTTVMAESKTTMMIYDIHPYLTEKPLFPAYKHDYIECLFKTTLNEKVIDETTVYLPKDYFDGEFYIGDRFDVSLVKRESQKMKDVLIVTDERELFPEVGLITVFPGDYAFLFSNKDMRDSRSGVFELAFRKIL